MKSIILILFILIISITASYSQKNEFFKRKTGQEEPYYKNKWYFGISPGLACIGCVVEGAAAEILVARQKDPGRLKIQEKSERRAGRLAESGRGDIHPLAAAVRSAQHPLGGQPPTVFFIQHIDYGEGGGHYQIGCRLGG